MDAHTARCLQLSTSIRMPFNPYRQYRVPDHLNRSRFPVDMAQQRSKAASTTPTPTPNKSWAVAPTKPALYTGCLPATNSQNPYTPRQSLPSLSPQSTPESTATETSCFSTCLTPENTNLNDLWDEAFEFTNSNIDCSGFGDLGLDLGAAGNDFFHTSTNFKDLDSDAFAYSSMLNDFEPLAFEPGSPDRQSSSSISESSGGFLSDFPEFPDFPDFSPQVELACFNPEIPTDFSANENYSMSFGDATPKLAHNSFVKRQGRSVAEASPRSRYRTSPYPVTGRGRSFSTGSVALPKPQSGSYIHRAHQSLSFASQTASPATDSADFQPFNDIDFDMYCQSQTTPMPTAQLGGNSMFLPFSFDQPIHETDSTTSFESLESANVLQSSATSVSHCEHHFAGSSEPPDLFGPLEQEQLSPPPEDMQCEGDDAPRIQELRFEGDLYTPKYVRGHGNKREGWCGICKPGRWLVLKNSAFWYDKSFTHGISAATGTAFEGPVETRRMKGNPDVWEGLCSSCGDWIALISSKKKGTTWFRHAYKCHTHQRVKDTPKRKREITHARAKKASKAVEVKSESRDDSPFLLDSPLTSLQEEMESQNGDVSNRRTISPSTV